MSKLESSLLMVLAIAIAIIFAQDCSARKLHSKLDSAKQRIEEILNAPADTVYKRDTITITKPVPVAARPSKEKVAIPDTLIIQDTLLQVYELPREELIYKGEDYRAVVSGVQPRLDSIAVFPKTIEINKIVREIERKKTRWGIGIQAGYGYNGREFSPYIGVGVQYSIFTK